MTAEEKLKQIEVYAKTLAELERPAANDSPCFNFREGAMWTAKRAVGKKLLEILRA